MTTSTEPQTFGALLRQHRLAASLSQEALGDRAQLSANAIAALERGRRTTPRPGTVVQLADALGLTPGERAALVSAVGPAKPVGIPMSPGTALRLPVSLTSFVGREREVAEVRRLLGTARLLTLTGAGGIGKTRLALEAARLSADVAFVDLAPHTEGQLVSAAIAVALGIPEKPRMLELDLLTATLASRSLLLILDNCEHLVTTCSEIADHLLHACPQLRILATSRQPLAVAGEQLWPVPPLAVVGPTLSGKGPASEAVRLFAERARLVQPDFELVSGNAASVTEVCRRLDGIPLAIELAAARVRVLGLEGIAARLDERFRMLKVETHGVPVRQQTLRATMGWSYDLLSKPEQAFFRRLSVFAGGWTLAAVEAVWDSMNGMYPEPALELLERLVDRSLVRVEAGAVGAARYAMLDTIREFALEQLRASDVEAAVRRRHSMYVLALAEQAEPELWSSRPEPWVERLDQDLDNARAALQWFIESDDDRNALKLGAALGRVWLLSGRYREGQVLVTRLLNLAGAQDQTLVRAMLLRTNATLCAYLGDFAAAQTLAEAALELMRLLGTDVDIARTLILLGETVQTRGDYAFSSGLLAEAVVLSRRAGAAVELVDALHYLGGGDGVAAGEYVRARARAEECLELALKADYLRGVARARWVLGSISYMEHDFRAARLMLEASIAAAHELGDHWATVQAATWLGHLTVDEGNLAAATVLFGHTLELGKQLGDREIFCLFLEGAAHLAAAAAQPERALRLAGAAAAEREVIDAVLFPAQETLMHHWLAPARAALGEAQTSSMMAAGRTLSHEQALVEASGWDATRGRSAGRICGPLTRREEEVAVLLARGLSNPQIAGELMISARTAQRHVENILGKLGFGSRAQVAAWAVGEGFAPSSQTGYRPIGPSSA